MIPNVFISSTVEDLHYLREGLREAVIELAYRPVMSEYGEVGYINPGTAAESCYRSVKECQMAVIIVGCRYGQPSAGDGISVTHKEFRTAQEAGIPLIAFVEKEVMTFKKVFHANQEANVPKVFPRMDNACLTFALLDEITDSPSYNGLLQFTNVAEAKALLKRQIADLVGQTLSKVFSPMSSEIKDVLAEIKTLRKEFENNKKADPKFLQAVRYVIDENRAKGLRYLIDHAVGPIDEGVSKILESKSFDEFIEKIGFKLVEKQDLNVASSMPQVRSQILGAMSFFVASPDNPVANIPACFIVMRDQIIEMNPAAHSHFDWVFHALKMEVGNS